MQDLFAARLPACVGGIANGYNQFVGAWLQMGGYIKPERQIAAVMAPDRLAVQPDLSLPVDRPEVEQDVPAQPFFWDLEDTPVPQAFFGQEGALDTREGRLDGIGHQDAALRGGEGGFFQGGDGIVPPAIQVQPVRADQLGTRVAGQGAGLLRGPTGAQGFRLAHSRLPQSLKLEQYIP